MKNLSLFIVGVTSLVSSRSFFAFINDPEGPNLLIVLVLAAIVFCVSLAIYTLSPMSVTKKLLVAVLAQILLIGGLYLVVH